MKLKSNVQWSATEMRSFGFKLLSIFEVTDATTNRRQDIAD